MSYFGIDVSNHQGNINWSQVKSAGVQVAYIKATEGDYFKDKYAVANYNGAKANGIKVGFYHFLNGRAGGRTQAEYFYNYLKETNMLQYDCKLCLDVEVNVGATANVAFEFCQRLKEISGQDILIYTGPSFSNSNLDGRFAQFPCWIAHYTSGRPMASNIWGTNYAGHQYSSSGSVSGINGRCDVDRYEDAVFLGAANIQPSNPQPAKVTSVTPHDYLGTDHKRRFVQYCLNVFGYNLKVDGIIGACSEGAIRDYQRTHGLADDGLVGPKTWTSLRNNMPTCRRGSNGNAVRCIQYLLNCGVDGAFGPKTETAVRNFQSQSGIGVDGVVGRDTWGRLFGFCFV